MKAGMERRVRRIEKALGTIHEQGEKERGAVERFLKQVLGPLYEDEIAAEVEAFERETAGFSGTPLEKLVQATERAGKLPPRLYLPAIK